MNLAPFLAIALLMGLGLLVELECRQGPLPESPATPIASAVRPTPPLRLSASASNDSLFETALESVEYEHEHEHEATVEGAPFEARDYDQLIGAYASASGIREREEILLALENLREHEFAALLGLAEEARSAEDRQRILALIAGEFARASATDRKFLIGLVRDEDLALALLRGQGTGDSAQDELETLGDSADPAARRALAWHLAANPEAEARVAAADAAASSPLGGDGNGDRVREALLASVLGDPDPVVRAHAGRALAARLARAGTSDPRLAGTLGRALAVIETESGAPEAREVARAAIRILGRLRCGE